MWTLTSSPRGVDIGPNHVREVPNAERSEVGGLVARTLEAAPVPDAGTETGSGWEFVDLDAILDGSYDPPVPTLGLRTDGVGLLYPGRVHSFSGEPGGGKTWLALAQCAEVMAQGLAVVFVDYEDTPAAIVARLAALGVPAATIREHFHYVRPDGEVDTATVDRIVALRAALVVIDSVGESLAVEGLNPNADDEVARWFRRFPRKVAQGGASVVILDHVAKDSETRGNWAIGSQRKLAAIDGAAYTVTVKVAPTRDEDGHLVVKCAKDRHGTHRRGDAVAQVHVENLDSGGVRVTVRRPEGGTRPTTYMERVSAWLEANVLDAPHSGRAITDGVEGKGPKIREALRQLVEEGFVVVEFRGSAHLHRLERPYVQAADPASDRYEGATFLEAVRNVAESAAEPAVEVVW